MKLLELFSGTGSVGKVAKEKGIEVVSLDLTNADININILDWDYTNYSKGDFDIIWASPPCATFSKLQDSHIGRSKTKESILYNIENIGLPLLYKVREIIDYFEPTYYYIENPQTGKMKNYILDLPYFDVDYCKYADWGYRKRTRIWTNFTDFVPKLCKKDCNSMSGNRHSMRIGKRGDKTTLKDRYRIPPKLIGELFKNLS